MIDFLKNPSSIITDEQFSILVQSKTYTESLGVYTTSTECLTFSMPDNFLTISSVSPYYSASVVKLVVVPASADVPCWFAVSFQVMVDLQVGSVLKIKVPSAFTIVNNRISIECYARTGFYSFRTCAVEISGDDSFITFVLLEKYQAGTLAEVDVVGYSQMTFGTAAAAAGTQLVVDIAIAAYFDNTVVAQSSGPSRAVASVYSLPASNDLAVSLTVSPMNEAEIATYTFNVTFAYLSFDETDMIWVRFPTDYDINLGQSTFSVASDLAGALKVRRRNRELFLSEGYTQQLKTSFFVSIYGIMNTNKVGNDPTGAFSFAILKSDFSTLR